MENFLGNEKLVSFNPFKKYLLGAYSGLWAVNHRRCLSSADGRKEKRNVSDDRESAERRGLDLRERGQGKPF